MVLNTRPGRYRPQVPGYDSQFGAPSIPYIEAIFGAAHCRPISVHIWFGFEVNLSDSLRFEVQGSRRFHAKEHDYPVCDAPFELSLKTTENEVT
jgi:hypothetical protein